MDPAQRSFLHYGAIVDWQPSLTENSYIMSANNNFFILQLNLTELQGLCKTLQGQFCSDPVVWLKDLASFLNLRLNPTTPVDSAYRQEQSAAAPLDYVSIPIREVGFFTLYMTSKLKNCEEYYVLLSL